MKYYLIFLSLILPYFNVSADVLKPALIEITIFDNIIELRMLVNLEAILSETNTNLKNTKNTKNEDKYKILRTLNKQQLENEFLAKQTQFLQNIALTINAKRAKLQLINISIDDVGYTKRARKSLLIYNIKYEKLNTMHWFYHQKYGDSAFRWRFYKQDEYSWNNWQIIKNNIEIDVIKFKSLSLIENLIVFIKTGFYHVIPIGLDHILFIIAMALSVFSFWKIFALVSSFTLAHTITLALASFDIITISSNIVEPLIAISITFIALENLFFKYNHIRQLIEVFIFGLLHGLGFATILKSFINDSFISSLIGFNLGVELAQLVIVLTILAILFIFKKLNIKTLFLTIPVNLMIAIIAIFMIFSRIY